jgi:hypothetical protein
MKWRPRACPNKDSTRRLSADKLAPSRLQTWDQPTNCQLVQVALTLLVDEAGRAGAQQPPKRANRSWNGTRDRV